MFIIFSIICVVIYSCSVPKLDAELNGVKALQSYFKFTKVSTNSSFTKSTTDGTKNTYTINFQGVEGFNPSIEDSCKKYANIVVMNLWGELEPLDSTYNFIRIVFNTTSESNGVEFEFAELYSMLSENYSAQNMPDSSIFMLNKAIRLKPKNAVFYNNRAAIYYNKKDFDLAIKDLNKAVELEEKNKDLWLNLGVCYAEDSLFDKSLDCYLQAISIDSYFEKAYAEMGKSYFKMKKYDLAVDNFERALLTNSTENVSWLSWKGRAYYEFGNMDSSKVIAKRVLIYDSTEVGGLILNGLIKLKEGKKSLACNYFYDAAKYDSIGAQKYIKENCLK